MLRLVPLFGLVGCVYAQGSLGGMTPTAGELDRGAQKRFAGNAGVGTGYVSYRGGAFGGLMVEEIPAGKHHAGLGAFAAATIGLRPGLSVFGRLSYTGALSDPKVECPADQCGHMFGLAVGPQLVDVMVPREGDDGEGHNEIEDGPSIVGAALAVTYRREDLNGEIGHYIGVELSMMFGGWLTHSRR